MPSKSKAKDAGKTAADGAAIPAMAFFEIGARNMELMARASQEMTAGLQKASQDMAEFVGARLQKDMQCAQALSQCRTPDAAFEVQRGFVEEAISDYQSEAARLLEISKGAAASALEPLEEAAAQSLKSAREAGEKTQSQFKAAADKGSDSTR